MNGGKYRKILKFNNYRYGDFYMSITDINWDDPTALVTPNFTVKETCWLPSWGVLHKPNDVEKQNILDMAQKMEKVREYLGNNSININCWIRPTSVNCDNKQYAGKNYNLFIGGAPGSAHLSGKACDFTVSKITVDEVKSLLKDKLEEFDLRMEKNSKGWVHLGNDYLPGRTRYFLA